ncbi:MAG: hypothetical protein ACI9Z9_003039 [Litorivivens sp.]
MKLPHKILLILLLGVLAELQASPTQSVLQQIRSIASHPVAGGCSIKEPWGDSVYVLDGHHGIYHYVWHSALAKPQLVRFVATDTGVTLCTLADHALVFVDPAQGVYQIDRAMEGDGEQLWIAPTPLGYGPDSKFQVLENHLYLVSGATRDALLVDTAVRNDELPELYAALELGVGPDIRLGAPVQSGPETISLSGADQQYTIDLNTLKIQVLPNIPAHSNLRILNSDYLSATLAADFIDVRLQGKDGSILRSLALPRYPNTTGLCLGDGAVLVSFGRDGRLDRYKLTLDKESAEQTGHFQLANEVVSCLFDERLRRLYVVEKQVGIWVFDLTQTGLMMPRAVTTDKIVESLIGVALYDDGEQGFVISQSVGNGAFLVFDRTTMALRGQFRVVANIQAGLDGVRSSRGFIATANPLPRFPLGLLVVHDQRNRLPDSAENLKLVDWREIIKILNANKTGVDSE